MQKTILLTDYAWPDDSVERSIVESAGFRLVTGPANPASAETIERLSQEHQPEAILTCWAQVTDKAIRASEGLKIVARLGVGLDNIDVETATSLGIWVTNVPDYCLEEVSDHAVGMVLDWTRGITLLDRAVRAGVWDPSSARLRRLSTLTCGIVGFGRIGRSTARKLAAFGPNILSYDPFPGSPYPGVTSTSLDDLLAQSDVVIVHAPLMDSTHHLINDTALAKMKPNGLLVNVSRGGVVDTDAVICALNSGRLGGAAFDVLESEPKVPEALTIHSNVVITPHVAFSSDASLLELRQRATQEAVRVVSGGLPHQARNSPKF